MFCPKCNQQQSSDEMRYCSRCGFPLATVAILLNNDGALPLLQGEPNQTCRSSRSKIITESLILTSVTWTVALLAVIWFDYGGPLELVAKLAAVVFGVLGLIGLLRFLYAFLFINAPALKSESTSPDGSIELGSVRNKNQSALPPQQNIPLNDWQRRPDTREMTPQLSVTENTTRLLDEDLAKH